MFKEKVNDALTPEELAAIKKAHEENMVLWVQLVPIDVDDYEEEADEVE